MLDPNHCFYFRNHHTWACLISMLWLIRLYDFPAIRSLIFHTDYSIRELYPLTPIDNNAPDLLTILAYTKYFFLLVRWLQNNSWLLPMLKSHIKHRLVSLLNYLTNRSIHTDEPKGNAYAVWKQLMKMLSMQLTKETWKISIICDVTSRLLHSPVKPISQSIQNLKHIT